MTKIAFIGAGSFVFTRNLVRDLLTFPLLQDATIALMDIDPQGLEFARCTPTCSTTPTPWRCSVAPGNEKHRPR